MSDFSGFDPEFAAASGSGQSATMLVNEHPQVVPCKDKLPLLAVLGKEYRRTPWCRSRAV